MFLLAVGRGQAAATGHVAGQFSLQGSEPGQECCFLGFVSLCPCMVASPFITHLSVHDVGPQGGCAKWLERRWAA